MTEYQVIARKFRPQTFGDVVGQEAIVTALKNGVRQKRLSHAYLFSGPRGTGKTTLARILAKAINCQNITNECEPCNQCQSCLEITGGHSLDVLEIDGASHRGIDDIRKINETVGYATALGGYKIFIIDEVHMLTKEAFNALLKTLEEPPPKVKFFFATTEPHKVLPTILSRCQRFNLSRIPQEQIISKLKQISDELKVNIDEGSLRVIATKAEGGLRDAESILDQIVAFESESISIEKVNEIFGLMPLEALFSLDKAGKEGNLAKAFEVASDIYSQGKDLLHFVEMIVEHIRCILQIILNNMKLPATAMPEEQQRLYLESAKLYSQEQCLDLLDYLVEAQQQIRFAPSGRIALEVILLYLLRSHRKIPIEALITRLGSLEQKVKSSQPTPENYQVQTKTTVVPTPPEQIKPKQIPSPAPITKQPSPEKPKKPTSPVEKSPAPIELGARPTPEATVAAKKEQSHYDTLMQFAAVELEGTVKKNRTIF